MVTVVVVTQSFFKIFVTQIPPQSTGKLSPRPLQGFYQPYSTTLVVTTRFGVALNAIFAHHSRGPLESHVWALVVGITKRNFSGGSKY